MIGSNIQFTGRLANNWRLKARELVGGSLRYIETEDI